MVSWAALLDEAVKKPDSFTKHTAGFTITALETSFGLCSSALSVAFSRDVVLVVARLARGSSDRRRPFANDGTVLIVGGQNWLSNWLASAELYGPATLTVNP